MFQQLRDKTCPLRSVAREREKEEVILRQTDDVSENLGIDKDDVHHLRRRSFSENSEMDEFNVHWLGREYYKENIENADTSVRYKLKNNKSLMSRRNPGHVIKPLDSLESCVAAQLCNEDDKIEEYMYTQSPLVTHRRPTFNSSERPFNTLEAHDSGVNMFFIGIMFGLFSMVMAKKREEVERLSKKLKESENLVQDLREELDMKDELTVKELPNENSQQNNSMVEDDYALRNTIEAELEAELERLELNLKASSDYDELDEDIEPNLKVSIKRIDSESESEPEYPANNYYNSPYYAVSPKELKLRLHEVIEARLEERIKELETALQQSPTYMYQYSSKDESQEMHQSALYNYNYNNNDIEDQTSTNLRSSEKYDTDNDDDELDMLLIKRIVERQRSGINIFVNCT